MNDSPQPSRSARQLLLHQRISTAGAITIEAQDNRMRYHAEQLLHDSSQPVLSVRQQLRRQLSICPAEALSNFIVRTSIVIAPISLLWRRLSICADAAVVVGQSAPAVVSHMQHNCYVFGVMTHPIVLIPVVTYYFCVNDSD